MVIGISSWKDILKIDDSETKDNSLKLKSGLIISIKKTAAKLKTELNDFELSFKKIHNPEFNEDLSRMIASMRELRKLVVEYNKK